MNEVFFRKLQSYAALSAADMAELRAACGPTRELPARHDLVREGDKPGPLWIMLDGWGCRYNMLPEGTRQISAFLMPGDSCDMHAALIDEMDHSIATLTPARVTSIPRARLESILDGRPALMRAFWTAQLIDESTLRAWIVSMGRRDSLQRVAHLMSELYARASSVGLTADGRFELPLTQVVLGDALGLTPVHVNRVLRRLRLSGVMELSGGTLVIADVARLTRMAGFDETYLHRRMRRAA